MSIKKKKMENSNYTIEEKLDALLEIFDACRESLMCLITMDITLCSDKLTDTEKLVKVKYLLTSAFTYQDTLKKFDLNALR
jgi:hypothetical protein